MRAGPERSLKRVDSYGAGGFRVAGESFKGSIVVWADGARSWPVASMAGLTIETLAALLDVKPPLEILLIGCGRTMAVIAPDLRQALRGRGIAVDTMDTGAACRTYNVLVAEERRVAAALIAVD
ncbi:MAG: Mth938-like domain-containing protein [Proteobacteria bacterium]|nr:Mth938-like domain-containing protein [Pseudomonadota bacterium]